ncbi:MAG: hypothetical protein H8E44_29265 [Planctomycetes bacterium]|nr:hypothetical protein [Planctomycetota bacterium]MBL7042733.1 hypothetical protein [Pirellulaceae bacterium]
MARNDYIPDAQNDFLAWHDNFNAQVAAMMATFGLTQEEVDAAAADNTVAHDKAAAADAAKAAQQAATADRRTAFKTVESNARSLANRLKAHAAYTEALGEQLGIVGPEDTTDLTNAQPTLTAQSVNPGNVTIGFDKTISDGVMIHSKRGAETVFTMLAWDTRSPYLDNRPNLAPGPETREYRAQYFKDDEPIGQFSDVLQVTVPG